MRHAKLVGAVSNPDTSGSRESGQAVSTDHGTYAVRLKTAPTGPDGSGSKSRGESVHLFLESTINILKALVRKVSTDGSVIGSVEHR